MEADHEERTARTCSGRDAPAPACHTGSQQRAGATGVLGICIVEALAAAAGALPGYDAVACVRVDLEGATDRQHLAARYQGYWPVRAPAGCSGIVFRDPHKPECGSSNERLTAAPEGASRSIENAGRMLPETGNPVPAGFFGRRSAMCTGPAGLALAPAFRPFFALIFDLLEDRAATSPINISEAKT